MEEEKKVPRHVAIILDGNGRWAKKRMMPRTYGHAAGAKNVEPVCRAADALGIRYLTLYAFSTENWKRSEDEVAALMRLLRDYLKNCIELSERNNMRVLMIGDRTRLASDIQDAITKLEAYSASKTGLTLIVAINYGGRDEICRGISRLLQNRQESGSTAPAVTEAEFSQYLDTAGIPDPDLMIRTSGEQRLSNYLLWQLAYSELYFTDVFWPDFDAAELKKAVDWYGQRTRRFGGT